MFTYRPVKSMVAAALAVAVAGTVAQPASASVTFESGKVVKATVGEVQSVPRHGEVLPVGATIAAGKGGEAVLNYLGIATVELAENTRMIATGMLRRGRECVVDLTTGQLTVQTLEVPESCVLMIRTPIGTCIAEGTSFQVSYKLLPDLITEEMEVKCTAGQLKLAGPYLSTVDDTLRAGGYIRFQVVNAAQRKCVYFPQIHVDGQDLNLTLGGRNAVLVHAGSTLEVAMDSGPKKSAFATFLVTTGKATVEGQEIAAGTTPAFVNNGEVSLGSEGQLPWDSYTKPKQPGDLILSHDGSRLTIAGEEYDTDVILYPDRVVAGEWIRQNDEFFINELKLVPKSGVEELILGMGPEDIADLPDDVLALLTDSGVKVTVLPPDRAVIEYNNRVKSGLGGGVAAAIAVERALVARQMPMYPQVPLNPYPSIPDAPQSPGDISSVIERPILIPAPGLMGLTTMASTGCCFSSPYALPPEIRSYFRSFSTRSPQVPSYVRPQAVRGGKQAELPELPGQVEDGEVQLDL